MLLQDPSVLEANNGRGAHDRALRYANRIQLVFVSSPLSCPKALRMPLQNHHSYLRSVAPAVLLPYPSRFWLGVVYALIASPSGSLSTSHPRTLPRLRALWRRLRTQANMTPLRKAIMRRTPRRSC